MKPANPVDKYMVAIKKNNVVVGHLLLVSSGNIISSPTPLPPPPPPLKLGWFLFLKFGQRAGHKKIEQK